MKKRLRKKKHIGEFREYGFLVIVNLKNSAVSSEEAREITDSLIDFVESKNAIMGGSPISFYTMLAN